MNKLKGSLIAKSIAVILFCALCLGCAVSAAAAGMLYSAGLYSRGAEAARETGAVLIVLRRPQEDGMRY